MFFFKFLISNSKKLLLGLCLFGSLQAQSYSKGFPKEYYEINDINESKNYFFNHMYEIVAKENNRVKSERRFVEEILGTSILNIDFDSASFHKLLSIKQKYKIKNIYTLHEYQKKIDIVPPSLAIAQAAVESAWGKSRFVKEASNIFGHWTYNEEIGIIPKRRSINSSHFIRVFSNLRDSTSAYILNLNRNLAYKSFQEKRYEQRLNSKQPDGLTLSQTMLNYSGIAHEYLVILKDLILLNNLQEYDNRYYQQNH
ncbi:glucosaminidase domain-containing protein [Arcobacter sp. s6]|jgi:Bax protein|uniref:glucosaminidase domain-containing protein n=1 Tax=Arcobacter sp. s6 TaxID=3230363 RepID=UPI0034A05A12